MSKLSEMTPKTPPKNALSTAERKCIDAVWTHYQAEGRDWLPWRHTTDAYHILVSEVMCQQTQVDRVVPKYEQFLAAFPNIAALSEAPLSTVLRVWQGLGYNRRAKMLHQCAVEVMSEFGGEVPDEPSSLQQLSGIGPYTAGAVAVFAYNKPVPLVETNIRTAYLYHFFSHVDQVSEADVLALVERTMDTKNPRAWFSALMDYGAHIKRIHGNQNQRSAAYARQSPFRGSDRQVRGAILKALSGRNHTHRALMRSLSFPEEKVSKQLLCLEAEGMVEKHKRSYRLPH